MPADQPIQNIEDAQTFLRDRPNFERMLPAAKLASAYKLERMVALCTELGHPERLFPAVHVAGTKGKGSTSTMLAAVLQSAGYHTGLYTSPHLDDVRERIVLDGTRLSPGAFLQCLEQVRPAVQRLDRELAPFGPTYFEVLTAAAFVHFAQEAVQVAVLEVGLGGRLDSTNVCHPVCCVITNISHDHTRQLGRTLAAIAREKAGIAKAQVPLVSGALARTARQVIEQTARQNICELFTLKNDFQFQSRRHPSSAEDDVRWYMDYDGLDGFQLHDLELKMPGRHQHANAAVALATCQILQRQGWKLGSTHFRQGLSAARAPARLEVVQHHPLVVLDTAHNEASMAATVQGLRDYWPRRRPIVVLATTRGKDILGILNQIMPVARCLILTCYRTNPRSNSVERMAEAADAVVKSDPQCDRCLVIHEPNPELALRRAFQQASHDDLICVTGSFFLAAELLPALRTDRVAQTVASPLAPN